MKGLLFQFLSISIFILATSCKPRHLSKDQKKDKPNIIFILVTNAYAAAPVCSPTRASILTGNYPATVGITDWITGKPSWENESLIAPEFSFELAHEDTTIAEKLKQHGYRTTSIGKWHLGGEGSLPTDHGFDTNVAGNEAGLPPSYFYPYTKGDFVLPDLHENGEPGEFLTDRITSEAMNWIKENPDEPFFLYLSYFTVHIWLETKPELKVKYQKKQEERNHKSYSNPVYAGMIETLDKNIGYIINELETMNILENTLIIFYSDNGGLHKDESENTPATDNGIYREGKGHLYEGGIREPLIFYWKGKLRKGIISDAIVTSTDFYPTILDFCGVAYSARETEGISLFTHLKHDSALAPRSIYWHYPHYSYQLGKPAGAVRSDDFKLIQFYEDSSIELYNLKEDPGETRNIAKENPEKAAKLQNNLNQWLREVNAKMPEKNPNFKPVKLEE